MEASSLSPQPHFQLTTEQSTELRVSRQLSLPLESTTCTVVNLDADKPILTVVTTFRISVRRSGSLLRALNEANKATTVGCFIFTETEEIAIKTTTFYPESIPVPAEQISEIIRSHYTEAVQRLVTDIQTASKQ